MTDYQGILAMNFLGNTIQDYVIAFAIFIGLWIGFLVFKSVILCRIKKWSKRTKTQLDDELVSIIDDLPGFAYFYLSFYIALYFLNVNSLFGNIATAILIILLIFWSTKAISQLIELVLKKFTKEKSEHQEKSNAYYAINLVAKIILWSTGFLLVLSNLGVNISSLVASLGIGGIAIALAVQNILSDMFSSFSIYFDKPFEIGDYIVVGDQSGTVKKIGIKTTRVQALQGEEVVFSNRELTSSMVRNFKKMKKRRIAFFFGVEYGTSNEKLEKIPQLSKKIIEQIELAEFDRAHFKEFGDSSLKYEVVYFINSREYNDYMYTQQTINLELKKIFEKENISMAFPTQTIHLKK